MTNQSIFRGSPHYYEKVMGETLGQNPIDFLSINLPPACNFRCGFCMSGMSTPRDFPERITDAEHRNLIREAVGLGVKHVEVSGEGEPFLFWENLREIIRISNELRAHVCVFTNGSLFTPEIIQELSRQDVSLAVSLENCDAGSHEAFVKRSDVFETVLRNIERLRSAFAHRIRKVGNFRVLPLAIHTIVMPQNLDQIKRIREIAGEDIFLSLAPYIPQGDGIPLEALATQRVSHEESERVQREYGDGSLIVADSAIRTHGYPVCGTFLYGIGVRSDGEVLFDAHAYDTAGKFGNVRDQSRTLKDHVENINQAKKQFFRKVKEGVVGENFCPLRGSGFNQFVSSLTI